MDRLLRNDGGLNGGVEEKVAFLRRPTPSATHAVVAGISADAQGIIDTEAGRVKLKGDQADWQGLAVPAVGARHAIGGLIRRGSKWTRCLGPIRVLAKAGCDGLST